MEGDMSRSRSSRLHKDTLPTSPSKYTKRELHERYFNLVENNTELKKTVNVQSEKLRILSTRLLRVNNSQKQHLCRTPTQCCTNAHKLIELLRATIDDLQQSNVKLTARNRMLSMRLSTQKQFSKISPSRASAKFRVASALDFSRQNTNRTTDSDAAPKVQSKIVTTARSPRECESNDSDVQTVISKDVPESERNSDRNRDSQANELLKSTISNLEEELKAAREASAAQEERSLALSAEVVKLQEEMREGVRAAAQRNLEEHRRQLQQLTAQMREAQAAANSLIAELAIEKKKGIELNAQLKAADMSKDVINMLEDHLILVTKNHNDDSALRTLESTISTSTETKLVESKENDTAVREPGVVWSNLTELFPGLKDVLPVHSNDEMGAVEIIRKLMTKVSVLQSELDVLEVSKINKISKSTETSHRSDETVKGDALSNNDVNTENTENSAFGNGRENIYIKNNVYKSTSNDGNEALYKTDDDDDNYIIFIDNNYDENGTNNWEGSAKCNGDDNKDTNTANDNIYVQDDATVISVNAEIVLQSNDTVASDPPIISTLAVVDKLKSLENVNNNQWNVKRSGELSIRKDQSESVIPIQTNNARTAADIYRDEDKKKLTKKSSSEASRLKSHPSVETTNLSYGDSSALKNKLYLGSNKTYIKAADDKSLKLSVRSLSSGNTERDVASIANTSEDDEGEGEGPSLSEVERDRELSVELTSSEYTSYSESAEADATINMFSDGEIPTSRERIRSSGGASVGARTITLTKVASSSEAVNVSSRNTSIKVEETLRAINAELHKCQVLLHPHKSSSDPTFKKL